MRFKLLSLVFIFFLSCDQKNSNNNDAGKDGYSVYYREISTKNSWVQTPSGIVFDKTEVLLLDSSFSGYQFVDTARAYNINQIAQARLEQLRSCRNALSIRNAGFVKLTKKQLANKENYLVMSGDPSFVFVYKILKDSADHSFSCELYGSHSRDSTDSRYSFHTKDDEVFTFRKYK